MVVNARKSETTNSETKEFSFSLDVSIIIAVILMITSVRISAKLISGSGLFDNFRI
jgi:hypothetical protein